MKLGNRFCLRGNMRSPKRFIKFVSFSSFMKKIIDSFTGNVFSSQSINRQPVNVSKFNININPIVSSMEKALSNTPINAKLSKPKNQTEQQNGIGKVKG